jgi:tetratricopeptide (TPR) repeat protein
MADAHSFRARLNMRLDLYHRAEPDFREALRLRRAGLGEAHYLVGYDWKNLAESLEKQSRYASADSAFDRSLSIFGSVNPEGKLYTASALLGKGRIQMALGRPDSAEVLFRSAVKIRERDLSADDWELAYARSHLGWSLALLSRFEEAEPLLIGAYKRLSEVHGSAYRLTREAAGHVAELYEVWKKPDLSAHYRGLTAETRQTETEE